MHICILTILYHNYIVTAYIIYYRQHAGSPIYFTWLNIICIRTCTLVIIYAYSHVFIYTDTNALINKHTHTEQLIIGDCLKQEVIFKAISILKSLKEKNKTKVVIGKEIILFFTDYSDLLWYRAADGGWHQYSSMVIMDSWYHFDYSWQTFTVILLRNILLPLTFLDIWIKDWELSSSFWRSFLFYTFTLWSDQCTKHSNQIVQRVVKTIFY